MLEVLRGNIQGGWRRIRPRHPGVALLVALFCAAALFDEEWVRARVAVQRLLTAEGVGPAESPLVAEARRLIRDERGSPRAVALLDRAAGAEPEADVLYWLGEVHLQRGENASAAGYFERVLELEPTRLPAWLKLSAVYERDARLDAAADVLRNGLSAVDAVSAGDPRSAASQRALRREIRRIEQKR